MAGGLFSIVLSASFPLAREQSITAGTVKIFINPPP
nr:MAG TPA: hypothetical protein [Caudoviricetes sp.]